jgi:hypothetical protein
MPSISGTLNPKTQAGLLRGSISARGKTAEAPAISAQVTTHSVAAAEARLELARTSLGNPGG